MDSAKMLRLILDSVAEGVIGVDYNGVHKFVNPAAERMLGYEPGELIGMSSHETWHHTRHNGERHAKEECGILSVYRDGKTHESEPDEIFWRKDDACFPVRFSSRPVYDQGLLWGAVITFMDITEQKKLESEVKILRGLLPICAVCKKIRDDKDCWHGVADYIRRHSEADFTHGLCPGCLAKQLAEIQK